MREMKLQDLKSKAPADLLSFAEEHSVENASTMRKQELMFAILKQLATQEVDIIGEGRLFSDAAVLHLAGLKDRSLQGQGCASC